MCRRTQMSSSGSRRKKASDVDDRFAVADERHARAALELPVSEQRDERRDENEVVDALDLRLADAFHRLVCDFGRRIVEKRNQQTAEPRVGDLADGNRDIAARGLWPTSLESLVRSSSVDSARSTSSGLASWPSCATAAVARMRGSGSARSGRANDAASSWLIDRQRPDRGGANAGVAIAEHAPDVRDPLLRDVAAHVAKRRQRTPADLWRLVVEEQRRHEVALVERLEDVDGVNHARRDRGAPVPARAFRRSRAPSRSAAGRPP